MSQPSVAQYFNTRKRSAVDGKIDRARKVLILSQEATEISSKKSSVINNDVNEATVNINEQVVCKVISAPKRKKVTGSNDIQKFLNNMRQPERCVTPPNQCNRNIGNDDLIAIKKKLCKSAKLGELKASINKFKESSQQLKVVEKRTNTLLQSPKLKSFKSIEFEVPVSPQKHQSPEKPYLSPKKESNVRRNLLNSLSPVKGSVKHDLLYSGTTEAVKSTLQLPFKYKTLSEMFRATDTVAQILYNRKEIITFTKLKPAIEEMMKRNFFQRYLGQFKSVYPSAYEYTIEKVKLFGSRLQREQWDLVLTPNIKNMEGMTSQALLDRRRKFNELLIDKLKYYHNEFLQSLSPPLILKKEDITRWHPEFDIEKVPDIEVADLPQIPSEEKYSSGKEVLEKARQMFNCNTRMQLALSKLKEAQERIPTKEQETIIQPTSLLKGIPKALLEKVRQKQAAKALMSMTRTAAKEKELQMYSRLPELARLTRNIFVSEKKTVLELDVVIDKLGNSYRCFLNKAEITDHLQTIAKEVPDWLVFHNLRNSVFLKLSKNADLSFVINKLEKLAKDKSGF